MPEPTPLRLRDQTFDRAHPAVMAIVNRTPDSFWSGNRHASFDAAIAALDDAVAAGADIVDVGGVRAGAEGEWVDADEETRRVVPFLQEARRRHPSLVLSLDTWRSSVARSAAGAVDLINDTWAGHDVELASAAAELDAGYVVSHTGGLPPRTDPVAIRYADRGASQDEEAAAVVRSVVDTLSAGAKRAVSVGIRPERVLVDPTLDFGKTTRHSLAVLRATPAIAALGFPVLQALSRKDFVGETLDLPADDRLEGTLAATAIAAWLGATVFRAHDVRATRRVLDMVSSIRGDRPPSITMRGEAGPGQATTQLR